MDPFIGQIIMFGGNFAPRGWAFCSGQLLPISQNSALFSILGTTYGGDGRTTFALPDLRGRAPIHAGHGPGLTDRRLGSRGGAETTLQTVSQMPNHTHSLSTQVNVVDDDASTGEGSAAYLANAATNVYSNAAPDATLAPGTITNQLGNTGGNQSMNNMPPYLTVNYIIALVGTFPSRS